MSGSIRCRPRGKSTPGSGEGALDRGRGDRPLSVCVMSVFVGEPGTVPVCLPCLGTGASDNASWNLGDLLRCLGSGFLTGNLPTGRLSSSSDIGCLLAGLVCRGWFAFLLFFVILVIDDEVDM
jgi:hypothetical protein